MIRYMLFPTGQKNPYLSLDTKSSLVTVRSSPGKQNITVTADRIYSIDPQIKIKSTRYLFAIGKSADDVQNYMVCATTKDTKHLAVAIVPDEKEDNVEIQFNVNVNLSVETRHHQESGQENRCLCGSHRSCAGLALQ